MERNDADVLARIITKELIDMVKRREIKRMQSDSPMDGSCSTCKNNRRGVCTLENGLNSG